jgi:DNA-directed RNA polymerase specialized sigma24 family protein
MNQATFGEGLRERDAMVLERFFDLYFAAVYGRVRSSVESTAEAELLTEGIFACMHRALPTLDPVCRLDSWVAAITALHIRAYKKSLHSTSSERDLQAADPDSTG